ncbi:MAG: hypothetical protein P1U36_08855 [Legionellaceae bacterium]|nr:hypothetical protein [Legionellaceae bacterium]
MKTNHTPILRGGTATLLVQLPTNRRQTLPEFSHDQTTQFKKNADAFALALIRLWTTGKSEHHESQTIPLTSISPETIHQQLVSGQSSNLGALTLLNLLLSNQDFPTSLSVMMDMYTGSYSFIQQGGRFWSDYIDPIHTYDFLAVEDSLEQSLARALSLRADTEASTDSCAAWWRAAMLGDDQTTPRAFTLGELFQFELFETALHVFLTPMPMLKHLGQVTLKQHNPDFNQHFVRKITHFKEKFIGMLSEHQHEQWLLWIARRGLFHVKDYVRYVSHSRISSELMQHIALNAIELSIPKLYSIISLEHMRNFTLNNKAQLFDYLIEQFQANWQEIARQSDNELWLFTDELVVCLNQELRQQSTTIGIDPDIKSFLCHFIMTCMSLKKHAFIYFLLEQDDTLVHVPILNKSTLLPEYEQWTNHSLLYFAQKQNNTEMVELLRLKGARLLMIESREETTDSQKSSNHYIIRRQTSFWELPQAPENKDTKPTPSDTPTDTPTL